MQLHVLVGQRHEAYPGEFAPEALAVIDDVGHSDNPEYLSAQAKEARDSEDFESLAIITIEVDGDAVMARLRPTPTVLLGKVVAA